MAGGCEGQHVVACALLIGDPAGVTGEIQAALAGEPPALNFEDKLFSGPAQRTVAPVALDRIIFSDRAAQGRRHLLARLHGWRWRDENAFWLRKLYSWERCNDSPSLGKVCNRAPWTGNSRGDKPGLNGTARIRPWSKEWGRRPSLSRRDPGGCSMLSRVSSELRTNRDPVDRRFDQSPLCHQGRCHRWLDSLRCNTWRSTRRYLYILPAPADRSAL